jgi:hypothetical protein
VRIPEEARALSPEVFWHFLGTRRRVPQLRMPIGVRRAFIDSIALDGAIIALSLSNVNQS